jgi:hypothetical protein
MSLRNRLMPFVEPDGYANENAGERVGYTVRSVYYDTPQFDALYQKLEGIKDRWKLRIRGYNSYKEGNQVFLEVKKKVGDRILKSRVLTDFDKLESGLTGGDIFVNMRFEEDGSPLDSTFFYHFIKDGYRPVSLVVYDREPYFGKFDHDVRITIDKNIRVSLFPQLRDLYSDTGLINVWKESFVLEVKYCERGMPSWMKSIIEEFQLNHQALSKFAEAFYTKDVSMYNLKLMERRC